MSSLSADMVQSKMMQSLSSMDSFRVGSTTLAKESHRNPSSSKTPSKYVVRTKYPLG